MVEQIVKAVERPKKLNELLVWTSELVLCCGVRVLARSRETQQD